MNSQVLTLFSIYSPILLLMGQMARQEAREEEARREKRFASTLVVAAAIIVAVRLAREDIMAPTPRGCAQLLAKASAWRD